MQIRTLVFLCLLAPMSDATLFVKFRCRGVDPWIVVDDGVVRLSSIDRELARAYEQTKERAALGWPIAFQ